MRDVFFVFNRLFLDVYLWDVSGRVPAALLFSTAAFKKSLFFNADILKVEEGKR